MTSKTQLANGAFSLLGIEPIVNVDDDEGGEAVAFRNLYDICRLEVLRQTSWRFAMRTTVPPKVGGTVVPGIGFTSAFQLPTSPKCIQIIKINLHSDVAWARFGDQIHCNEQPTIEYIEDSRVGDFDEGAVTCLMLLLASRLSVALKGSRTIGADLYGQYMEAIKQARQTNSHERGKPDGTQNSLRHARYQANSGFYRGNY